MSKTAVTKRVRIGGVLSDPGSYTYGVTRTDTGAVVVASGTEFERQATGIYLAEWDDPEGGLTYELTTVLTYDGEVNTDTETVQGGTGGAETTPDTDTVSIWSLLPHVIPYVAGCPEAVARQAIIMAIRTFAVETGIFREDVTLSTVESQKAYTITPATVAGYLRVFHDCYKVTVDDRDAGYTVNSRGIILDWKPTASGLTILASASVLPLETATVIPAAIMRRWSQAFVSGAMWWLKGQAATWRDGDGLALHQGIYERLVVEARMARDAEFRRAVTFVPFV